MKRTLTLALAAAAMAASLPAAAQFQKPEDAIKYRKAAFTVMAAHMGRIGAMAQGKAPFDAKAAAENAAIVETMSKLPFVAFVDGTDKGETRAKPEIWKDAAKFKAAGTKSQDEIAKMAAALRAPGLTLDQLKTAVGPVGGTCKACHDDFRKD